MCVCAWPALTHQHVQVQPWFWVEPYSAGDAERGLQRQEGREEPSQLVPGCLVCDGLSCVPSPPCCHPSASQLHPNLG